VGHLGTVSGVTAWIATPEQKSAADVLGLRGIGYRLIVLRWPGSR
jgi:hypothetical protein